MTAPPPPVEVTIHSYAPFQIMWLAGVRHVDLAEHCLKTFGQPDRHPVIAGQAHQYHRLDATDRPLAWYLCALPIPWKWSANGHLAFEYAPGYHWTGDATVPGLEVELVNARPITAWGEHSIPAAEPLRQSRVYRTCRNWQFAWWLRQNRAAPDAPPRPQPRRQQSSTLF